MWLIRQLPNLDPGVVQTVGAPVREASSLILAKKYILTERVGGRGAACQCVVCSDTFVRMSLCLFASLFAIHYQLKVWTHLVFPYLYYF